MARDKITRYRGFPSLTPEVQKNVAYYLFIGAPKELACQAAGIAKDTFYRWWRAAREAVCG